MAAVDPYAPCPCGSGEKFKWCCHKVESYADKAQRLYEGGQAELAIAALNEGVAKAPGNPWLLTRRALYQIGQGRTDDAKASLREALARHPGHPSAMILLTRLVLETEGPAAGAAQFQRTLEALPPEAVETLASLARVVSSVLAEDDAHAAALAHARLALELHGSGDDPAFASPARALEKDPGISAWLKNPYELAPAPGDLTGPARQRFDEALETARRGLWARAASAFERLAADEGPGGAADYNLGLCRLWLADDAAAVAALRRRVSRLGETAEAVDLEGLCQLSAPLRDEDQVENVQLIWPLRDREALRKILVDDPHVVEEGSGPIDESDPNSPEVDHFGLLDRPALESAAPGLRLEDVPKVVAHLHVGREIVALETFDDGRLDDLVERFRALAGPSIAPAHPKTKVLGKVGRATLGLMWEWLLPEGLPDAESRRLSREQAAWTLREAWPRTPMPYLGGRSPAEAARAGDSAVRLRAAMLQLEQARNSRELVDCEAMRAELGIAPEPTPDPATVDVERLHLGRLVLIAADELSDERLVALYRRARQFMVTDALESAARALIGRREAWEKAGISAIALHSDLAMVAASRGEAAEALEWIRRGRQADAPAQRARNAVLWDMLEVRIRARTEPPETWVPELAVVLDRHANDRIGNQTILLNLLEMGLVQMQPSPDNPDQVLVDTRALQMLMAEYGPRVTTASGGLGVSAARPEIWTPGSEAGAGGGGIWTPGSGGGAAPAGGATPGDKPKLIIPGR